MISYWFELRSSSDSSALCIFKRCDFGDSLMRIKRSKQLNISNSLITWTLIHYSSTDSLLNYILQYNF